MWQPYDGFSIPENYKARLFVTKLNGWKPFATVTNSPALGLQEVLDLPLPTSSGRNKWRNEALVCWGKLNTQWKCYS